MRAKINQEKKIKIVVITIPEINKQIKTTEYLDVAKSL